MSKVGGLDDTIWIAPPERGREPRSRAERISLFVLTAAITVGLVIAAFAFLSAKDYGTPAFWSLPKHVGYCGRQYEEQGTQTGNPALFTSQDSASGARWTFISWTFSGRSVYAVVAPLHPPAEAVCTMEIYIPVGGSQWATYTLSGGP